MAEADSTYQPKIQKQDGGDTLVVAAGGKIAIDAGGGFEIDGVNVAAELKAIDGLSATVEELNELHEAVVGYFGAAGTPVDGVRASLVLDSAAANSDLTLTAVEYGVGGHTITAEIVQGVGTSVPLSVEVVDRAITITLPTDEADAPVAKTATEVKAAYDAVAAAVALATCAKEGTGAGTVDESADAPLAGGVDVTAGAVPSFMVAAAGDLLFVKVSAQVWKKVAIAAL